MAVRTFSWSLLSSPVGPFCSQVSNISLCVGLNVPLITKEVEPDKRPRSSLINIENFLADIPKEKQNKESFKNAIGTFLHKNVRAKGHVEFIKVALRHMKDFGVHQDLDSYKRLIEVFPKGQMVYKNFLEVIFKSWPVQNECCVDILDEMEWNRIDPDAEVHKLVVERFGEYALAGVKVKKMLYWKPKLKNAHPYLVSRDKLIPHYSDRLLLAQHAIKMMCRDPANRVHIWKRPFAGSAGDDNWVVNGQSQIQSLIIANHPSNKPLYVDGPYRVWVWDRSLDYFQLSAENQLLSASDESSETHNLNFRYLSENLPSTPTMHEQPDGDGTICALCCPSEATQQMAQFWVKMLQERNERLAGLTVIFRMAAMGKEIDILSDRNEKND